MLLLDEEEGDRSGMVSELLTKEVDEEDQKDSIGTLRRR